MKDKRCFRCKHWDSFADVRTRSGEGLCRVRAPVTVLFGGGTNYAEWPRTGGEDWCGEFEATLEETRKRIRGEGEMTTEQRKALERAAFWQARKDGISYWKAKRLAREATRE